MSIKPGSLKCVVLTAPEDIPSALDTLREAVGREDVREFGTCALLVHTDEEASAVRDVLRGTNGVLVFEFEKWSGVGDGVPREWLLARGH